MTSPLKPTRTMRQLLEEILSRLPEAPSLPKPTTDETPPPSHHDQETNP